MKMQSIREINPISKDSGALTKDQRFQADGLHRVCPMWCEGHWLDMTHLHVDGRHQQTHHKPNALNKTR